MKNTVEQSPRPKAIIDGLRSIGYRFETAVADVIDNSIAADATFVKLFADPSYLGRPFFTIIDNGHGMDPIEIQSAMQFGSSKERNYTNTKEMGRFGLGLKTASMSQCKKFSVISKKNGVISGAQWDLDYIIEKDRWDLKILSDSDIQAYPYIDVLNGLETGTMVFWESFDILEKSSNNFEKSFRERVDIATDYCALVFHRFYDEVKITVNDCRLPKRDPFLEQSDHKIVGPLQTIQYEGQTITAKAYSLPLIKNLTFEEKELLGGADKVSSEQGFYIYRNRRLIVWGTWLHMQKRTAFTRLGRVKVDVPAELDKHWDLDVKKSQAFVPDSLKSKLWAIVADSVFNSSEKLHYQGRKETSVGVERLWERTQQSNGNVLYSINPDFPLIDEISDSLDPEHKKMFKILLSYLANYIPKNAIADDISSDTIDFAVDESKNDKKALKEELISIIRDSSATDFSLRCSLLDTFLEFEQYKSLEDEKDSIIEAIK